MPACSTFQLCSLISVSEITLSVSVIFSLLLQVKVFVYCLGMSVSFCTCNCYVMRLHICALKVCRGCASCAFKLKYRHCLSFSYICPSLSFFLSTVSLDTTFYRWKITFFNWTPLCSFLATTITRQNRWGGGFVLTVATLERTNKWLKKLPKEL